MKTAHNWIWMLFGALLFLVGSMAVHPVDVYLVVLDFLRDPLAVLGPIGSTIVSGAAGTAVAIGAIIFVVFGVKEIARLLSRDSAS